MQLSLVKQRFMSATRKVFETYLTSKMRRKKGHVLDNVFDVLQDFLDLSFVREGHFESSHK